MIQLFKRTYTKRQRLLLFIVLILAILIKSLISYYYFHFDADKINQAIATKNWVDGYGLTKKEANPLDLSKAVYTPLAGWPPGYSFLLAPIYLVCKDIQMSTIILMFISIILFFAILLNLLYFLKIPLFYLILLLLLPVASFNEDVVISTATDLLAVTACLYALTTSLKLINGQNKLLEFSFAISMTSLLRYMYWPISLLLPLLLLWIGYQKKDTKLKKNGIIGFTVALFICSAIYFFEKFYIGGSLYLFPFEKGFFPENLLRPYPFFISSFINTDFYAQQLQKILNIGYFNWLLIFSVFHLIIFFIFLFIIINKKLFIYKYFETTIKNFIFLSSFIYLIIIIVLAYLSITNSSYYPPPYDGRWTYISSDRYHLFMLITFPIITIILLSINFKRNFFYKLLYFSVITAISIEILHGIYFALKFTIPLNLPTQEKLIQKKIDTHIVQKINSNGQENIKTIIASHNVNHPQLYSLYGGIPLFKTDILNSGNIVSTQTIEIVLIILEKSFPYYSRYLMNPNVKLEAKIDSYYIFSYKYLP